MLKCYLVTAFKSKIRPKARLRGGAGADEDEPDALRREVRRERHERRELHLRVGKRAGSARRQPTWALPL